MNVGQVVTITQGSLAGQRGVIVETQEYVPFNGLSSYRVRVYHANRQKTSVWLYTTELKTTISSPIA